MNHSFRRDILSEQVLTALPFLLFFPVCVIYAAVLLFLATLLVSGDYRAEWLYISQPAILAHSPIF